VTTKKPHRLAPAGLSKSTAADERNLTENRAFSQPQARPFKVVIARDLWRRCTVSTDPVTITRQPRSFPDYDAALTYAEALAKLEGWPLIDRVGGAA
jgi:hypothetical protein